MVAGPGAGNASVSWDSAARQTVAARGRPCLSLTAAGAGLAGPALALARAKFKSTKLFKRKENLKIPNRPWTVMRP